MNVPAVNVFMRGVGKGHAPFWTTTDDQRALGLSSATDAQGRNWVFPGPACGVCGSVGGHLPQCPADGAP